jgi:hypothetical protein
MKTITTLEKISICNLFLFLIGAKVIYLLIDFFVLGMPYPSLFKILYCLALATFVSLKREEYKKNTSIVL